MIKKAFYLLTIQLLGISLYAQSGHQGVEITTDEVYEQYEEAFFSKDIRQMLKVYAENAILVTSDGKSHKGLEEIRKIYEVAFRNFPTGLTFQPLLQVAEERLVHRVHKIKSEKTGETIVPFSAETFLVENGKIKYHTIADYYPELDVEAPVALAVPEGWKAQTSPLPRYFAPGVYHGVADYAFAPGMFQPHDEDYFTYAMVFWLPIETQVDRQKLEEDLETYFDGLALAGDPGRDWERVDEIIPKFFDSLSTRLSVPQDSVRANVELAPVPGDGKWKEGFNGSLRIYDAMAAHQSVELNTRVRLQKCPASGYRAVFLEISPQPYTHELWNRLDEMAREWQCPEE